MKFLSLILGSINGTYMLLDGLVVLKNGKYIGPPKPGPWTILFEKMGLDVFKLGPLFVVYGLAWLFWVWAFYTQQVYALNLGLWIAIFTLWYLPLGTLFSLSIILMMLRIKFGT